MLGAVRRLLAGTRRGRQVTPAGVGGGMTRSAVLADPGLEQVEQSRALRALGGLVRLAPRDLGFLVGELLVEARQGRLVLAVFPGVFAPLLGEREVLAGH